MFLVLQGCNSKSEMGLEMSQLKKLEVEQVKPLHWWVGFESEELQLLVKSNQIQEILGYDYGQEVVHRNNLVLI